MAKKDGEYQQALAEPYTSAQPKHSCGFVFQFWRYQVQKGRSRAAQEHSCSQRFAHAGAEQRRGAGLGWKSSREDLETTRRDVNARMSSYERNRQ